MKKYKVTYRLKNDPEEFYSYVMTNESIWHATNIAYSTLPSLYEISKIELVE